MPTDAGAVKEVFGIGHASFRAVFLFFGFSQAWSLILLAAMKRVVHWVWVLAAFTLASSLRAGLMTPLSIEELVLKAGLIVQGKVLAKTCERDHAGRIFTRIDLEVAEVWKGSWSAAPLRVVHGGGTLGEERSIVSGQVEYSIGEEVIGFFVINSRGEAVTLGLTQGKFHVWPDAKTGEKRAANPFHGGGDRYSVGTAGKTENETLTVSALKQRIQGAIR